MKGEGFYEHAFVRKEAVMKTLYPPVDEHTGYRFGSSHRQHWQFAILAGVGMEVVIALSAFFAMLIALITLA